MKLHHWILGMDKLFHPTVYNECNYLSMLGLKLNHVSKRGPWCPFGLNSCLSTRRFLEHGPKVCIYSQLILINLTKKTIANCYRLVQTRVRNAHLQNKKWDATKRGKKSIKLLLSTTSLNANLSIFRRKWNAYFSDIHNHIKLLVLQRNATFIL